MPHDKNGTKLQKGDVVTLRCRVNEVYESDSCNVALEALDGKEYRANVTANADSVVLVEREEA